MADIRDIAAEIEDNGGAREDRLVFPINVHESLQASKGLKPSEKNGLIISAWITVSVLLGWFGAGWLRQIVPDYYFFLTLLAELALQLTAGTFLLRLLLDETSMANEMSNTDKSFAKYFGIYHEHIAEEGSAYPCDVIEFVDGSHCAYIMLLLGYNTNQASKNTYAVNLAVQQMINRSGMPHRITYSNEKFSNSDSAEGLRAIANGVTDPTLFPPYRDIVMNLINKANTESNVMCAVYQLYAQTRIQKEDLGALVENIVKLVNSEQTAYRACFAMEYREISEFYRLYYKLNILDMGLVRVIGASNKKSVACPVRLVKVYGASGKTYTTPDYGKILPTLLADYGLEQVNEAELRNAKVKDIPFEN